VNAEFRLLDTLTDQSFPRSLVALTSTMDDLDNHVFELPDYPYPTTLIPATILQDFSDDYYRVSWQPDDGGVVHAGPRLVRKQELIDLYPHVVDAWKSRLREQNRDATQQHKKFTAVAREFLGRKHGERPLIRGVDCDQSLLPGMGQHWGELRTCESHPTNRLETRVCKGCRVSHYAQESRAFDREVTMARGARVSVCSDCATKGVEAHAVGHRCVCDSKWTCFRCREGELEKLAGARKELVEGRCGVCKEAGDMLQHVDFCLYCRKWRVYDV
jgi:hypothetical protein